MSAADLPCGDAWQTAPQTRRCSPHGALQVVDLYTSGDAHTSVFRHYARRTTATRIRTKFYTKVVFARWCANSIALCLLQTRTRPHASRSHTCARVEQRLIGEPVLFQVTFPLLLQLPCCLTFVCVQALILHKSTKNSTIRRAGNYTMKPSSITTATTQLSSSGNPASLSRQWVTTTDAPRHRREVCSATALSRW